MARRRGTRPECVSMRRAITAFFRFCLRIFFRRIELLGLERVPRHGAVVFAVNHPNGLVDPLFLLCFAPAPVSFLAKAPLFGYPIIGWIVRAFDTHPGLSQAGDRRPVAGGANARDVRPRARGAAARRQHRHLPRGDDARRSATARAEDRRRAHRPRRERRRPDASCRPASTTPRSTPSAARRWCCSASRLRVQPLGRCDRRAAGRTTSTV